MPRHPLLVAGSACALLCACHRPPAPAPTPPDRPASAATRATAADAWLGRWPGPEGTFLDVQRGDAGHYRVTVQNLDGPRTFAATAEAGSLRFTRDGITETVRPGSGVDTGMKWLADKRDCLVVKAGEGYCRG